MVQSQESDETYTYVTEAHSKLTAVKITINMDMTSKDIKDYNEPKDNQDAQKRTANANVPSLIINFRIGTLPQSPRRYWLMDNAKITIWQTIAEALPIQNYWQNISKIRNFLTKNK